MNNTTQQKFVPVNLTMDSSRVLYADYQFSVFLQQVRVLRYYQSKRRKRPFWPYFQVPLDIKQQYLKSKYFYFQITIVFSSIRTRVITKKLKIKKDNKHR